MMSEDIAGFGLSKFTKVTVDAYVVPRNDASNDASKYYPDDYILNIYNYGIIFGDKIHWYEIGTSNPVLKTDVDLRIYENISAKHGMLIRWLNNLGFDIIPEWFREQPINYSKRAIKEESDRREYENDRALAQLEVLKVSDQEFLKRFLDNDPEIDKRIDVEVEKILASRKDET